jgi:hypothetical protein
MKYLTAEAMSHPPASNASTTTPVQYRGLFPSMVEK